jgi:NAD(P)-dependent dehydrogenase (short-subunit alcohol dehydrogenase family)
VLVNSAGIMRVEPIAEFEDATFDRVFAVNVRDTFGTLKQTFKQLRPGGRMINTRSILACRKIASFAPRWIKARPSSSTCRSGKRSYTRSSLGGHCRISPGTWE